MTLSTTTRRIIYTGNGILTTFAYPFRIFADADLRVLVNGVLKVLTVNYTVTGAGNSGGGNVVFGVAPGAFPVDIRRVEPVTQATDYVAGDSFPAETHEAALDKLTMLSQERGIDACERFGATTPTAASVGATTDTVFTWPVPFADANYTVNAVGIGATGVPLMSVQSYTSTTVTIRVTAGSAMAASFTNVHIIGKHD